MSTPTSLPPLDLNQRYTVNEACAYMRCSRSSFYKMVEAEQLDTIKMFSRTYVAGAEIRRQSLPQQAKAPIAAAPVPAVPRRGRGRPRGPSKAK
jgi:excisionase family DNA binding protein